MVIVSWLIYSLLGLGLVLDLGLCFDFELLVVFDFEGFVGLLFCGL